MDLSTRVNALLSRKFMAPVLGVSSFFVWRLFLQTVPIDTFATCTGALFGGFLLIEGIRDIILATGEIFKDK